MGFRPSYGLWTQAVERGLQRSRERIVEIICDPDVAIQRAEFSFWLRIGGGSGGWDLSPPCQPRSRVTGSRGRTPGLSCLLRRIRAFGP